VSTFITSVFTVNGLNYRATKTNDRTPAFYVWLRCCVRIIGILACSAICTFQLSTSKHNKHSTDDSVIVFVIYTIASDNYLPKNFCI